MRKTIAWILGLIVFVGGGAMQLLRWLSDIDFVVERTKEPGWLRTMFDILLAPTPGQSLLLTAVMMMAGIVGLYFGLRRASEPGREDILSTRSWLRDFRLTLKELRNWRKLTHETYLHQPQPPVIRNMTAWAAVDYIVNESEFGKNLTVTIKEFRGCEEFSRAAEHGDLGVEGRPQHHANTEDIVASYWRVGHLALLKYAKYLHGEDQRDGGETEQKLTDIVPSTFTVYVGLRVDENEVKKIWPVANTSA